MSFYTSSQSFLFFPVQLLTSSFKPIQNWYQLWYQHWYQSSSKNWYHSHKLVPKDSMHSAARPQMLSHLLGKDQKNRIVMLLYHTILLKNPHFKPKVNFFLKKVPIFSSAVTLVPQGIQRFFWVNFVTILP